MCQSISVSSFISITDPGAVFYALMISQDRNIVKALVNIYEIVESHIIKRLM